MGRKERGPKGKEISDQEEREDSQRRKHMCSRSSEDVRQRRTYIEDIFGKREVGERGKVKSGQTKPGKHSEVNSLFRLMSETFLYSSLGSAQIGLLLYAGTGREGI